MGSLGVVLQLLGSLLRIVSETQNDFGPVIILKVNDKIIFVFFDIYDPRKCF